MPLFVMDSISFARLPRVNAEDRGVARIWEGGGQEFFFSDLGIYMSRSDMLRMAKPCALLGGFGGMLPPRIFFKTVQFGAF